MPEREHLVGSRQSNWEQLGCAVAGGRCWRSTPPWEGFRNRHTGVGNSKASCMLCAVVAGATVECLSSTRTKWRIVCLAARAAAVLVQA
jgi:hypothetical protein